MNLRFDGYVTRCCGAPPIGTIEANVLMDVFCGACLGAAFASGVPERLPACTTWPWSPRPTSPSDEESDATPIEPPASATPYTRALMLNLGRWIAEVCIRWP